MAASRPLIVGLRNPGPKYEATRHNLGAEVVSLLADRHGGVFKKARRFIRAQVAEVRIGDTPAVLALPLTFMNESGQAVAPLMRYFKTPRDALLVIHDDIDLPFAKLRVSHDRGPGGNNGVKSIIRSLGAEDFWRLKVGVGRPPGRMDPAAFVLKRFGAKERPEIDVSVQLAADVVETFVAAGGEDARQHAGESNV
ncbi:MAG: aminoacyl-tRNA hydrolase [Acidimicrobiia bacterium]|nr:aminoacyl-tRNA hydrolase [Acidimicrobiia bacterium]